MGVDSTRTVLRGWGVPGSPLEKPTPGSVSSLASLRAEEGNAMRTMLAIGWDVGGWHGRDRQGLPILAEPPGPLPQGEGS